MSSSAPPTGYLSAAYAASLAEFGRPRELAASGGWVLERPIDGTPFRDAMGCYPLFCCHDWSRLGEDLDSLRSELVSFTMVADPFAPTSPELLRRCFDLVVVFKRHWVADLAAPRAGWPSKHHRYYARRAAATVSVELVTSPPDHLGEWVALYDNLIERHRLRGIVAFSRTSFAAQLAVPGVTMLAARCAGEAVAAHLWFEQGNVAYSHLQATSDAGYRVMAPYALHAAALEHFSNRVRWLNLGAGAGIAGGGGGLDRFKAGWANGSRTAHLCGRVLNPEAYASLPGATADASRYFPAYRAGEFA